MKTITSTWQIRTYDVLVNSSTGYEVNDVFAGAQVEIELEVECFNEGTAYQFYSATPSDADIAEIWGEGAGADDDETDIEVDEGSSDAAFIYIREKSTGKPVGEMYCPNMLKFN